MFDILTLIKGYRVVPFVTHLTTTNIIKHVIVCFILYFSFLSFVSINNCVSVSDISVLFLFFINGCIPEITSEGSFQQDHPGGRPGWNTPWSRDLQHHCVADRNRPTHILQQGGVGRVPHGKRSNSWTKCANNNKVQRAQQLEDDGCH